MSFLIQNKPRLPYLPEISFSMQRHLGTRTNQNGTENIDDDRSFVSGNDDDGHSRSSKRIKGDLFCDVSEDYSPLGLALRKSSSLLDLIQREVYGENKRPDFCAKTKGRDDVEKEEKERIKASNFPANLVKIGSWEKVSINEGNVVAKFYFAKRKLVWEILECRLKRKLEIQWSDISAIHARFPKNQPSVLQVELNRPPLFFEEKDPQPKRHTLWHPTSDFTRGQATTCRVHHLEYAEGTLRKHYEKLMAYDEHLKITSQTPFSTSPLFFPMPHNSLRNLNLYELDIVTRHSSNNPLKRNSKAAFCLRNTVPSSLLSRTYIRNSSPTPFYPHHATYSNYTSNDILPGFPPIDRTVQNMGLSKPFTSIYDNLSLSSVTGLYNHVSPLTLPSLTGSTVQKSGNDTEKSSSTVSSFTSSIWDLDDITDHLFNDQTTSVIPDDEALMKKIRSIDAHLNQFSDTQPNAKISYQDKYAGETNGF